MAFEAVGQQSKDDQISVEASESGSDGLLAATRACSPAVVSLQWSKQTPGCVAAFSGHQDCVQASYATSQTVHSRLWLAC